MAKSRKRDTNPQTPPPDSGESNQYNPDAERDRVAARAYELYLARGGSHGADWEDWLTAERELTGSAVGGRGESGREPEE